MDCRTEFLVTNIHCQSCVRTIEQKLLSLSPLPYSIKVSLVSRTVVVRHPNELSAEDIKQALNDAGFEIPADNSLDTDQSSYLIGKQERHIDFSKEREHRNPFETKGQLPVPEIRLNVAGVTDLASHLDPLKPTDTPLLVTNNDSSPSPCGGFRVTLAVGGMTCAACSTTVTRMISELSGVSDVNVDLLGMSATLIVDQEGFAETVAEVVEDGGYEAQVVSVESLDSKVTRQVTQTTRTISLRVEGMFCPECPAKVMAALDTFGSQITIIKPFTSYVDPILTLSYQPAPPSLSIRSIISAIAFSRTTPFKVSVYRPTSLEEISRKLHRRERYRIMCRLVFAFIVAIPTFILSIVYMSLVKNSDRTRMFLMEPMWTGNTSRLDWALFILATPVMFYSANLFHQQSIKEITILWRAGSSTPIWKRFIRFGSMNLLVSTGVSVAYFASIALLILEASQSETQTSYNTTYFDSVIFLTLFLLAGRFLEAYSKTRTTDSISALGSLYPTEAFVLVPKSFSDLALKPVTQDIEKGDPDLESEPGFKIEKIEVGLLEVGDIVRVRSGSSPPADGTIVTGDNGAFDESSLTGESKLVRKQIGDKVFVGTINKSGVVDIRVDTVGGATMLDHIIKVVREGQTRRAPIERVADLLTGYFVPVITLLAVSTWVLWLSLGLSGSIPDSYLDISVGGWPVWSLEFAIAVFVVACPCGIGLAAPTALLVGSGLAAKYGILARGGGEALQEMAQLDLIVFDKTGTLTEGGEPRVSDFEILASNGEWTRDVALEVAATLESTSSHPLATAIRQFCEDQGISFSTNITSQEIAGRGLKAHVESLHATAIIGNEAWMEEHDVTIGDDVRHHLGVWKSDAKSVILLAMRDETEVGGGTFHAVAIFAVMDPLRPEGKEVISSLQKRGIATWMISGDNITTAEAVARTVGIPRGNVIAGVLPHEKAERIKLLQRVGTKKSVGKWRVLSGKRRLNERCIVGMVGDGINDAPALTAADVGIAVGSGSDVAISSASFVLISSHLQGILTLSELSRKVFNRVKFNFFWAICYNIVALPIAAGALYPLGHIRLNPVWASLAMALSSVSVVCSSLLLRLYKPKTSRTGQ